MADFVFGISLFVSFFISLATLNLAQSVRGFFFVCLPIAVGFFLLVYFIESWTGTTLASLLVMLFGVMGIMIAENWDLFEKKE